MSRKKVNLHYKLLILLAFITLIVSCGAPITVEEDDTNYYGSYTLQDFEGAFSKVNRVLSDTKETDKYLLLLERAKIAYASGRYDVAIDDFQEAEHQFMNLEGVISISEEATALWLNDTLKNYQAEVYEQLMINPYIALCYLGKGDIDEAIVERNRSLVRINQYLESNSLTQFENPFARYLVAVLYEMEGNKDDAIIEYKKIINHFPNYAYVENDIKAIEGDDTKPINKVAKDDKCDDKATDKENPQENLAEDSELIIFFEIGNVPYKTPVEYKGYEGDIWLSFAYADYRVIDTNVAGISASIDNGEIHYSQLIYDLESVVLKNYEKNKSKIISKISTKMILQGVGQVAGKAMQESDNALIAGAGFVLDIGSKVSVAADKADERCWRTLPKDIYYTRIRNIKEGEHNINISVNTKYEKTLSKTLKLNFTKGKKRIVYYCFPQ